MMRDRLSDLPDEIRFHIISLLPSARLQASTAALSTRWRRLWTTATSLSFRLSDFSAAPWVDPVHTKVYPLAVDRLLELCTAPAVDRLSFDAPPSRRDPALDRWLCFAAARSACHLSLRFFSPAFSPPLSLLRCRSLSSLHLSGCGLDLRFPDQTPCFPSLKTLALVAVQLESRTFNSLIASTPILETLVVQDCRGLTKLTVSAPGVRNLAVSDPRRTIKLRIESPHLRSLFFNGSVRLLTMANSPQLHRACVLGGRSGDAETEWKSTLSAVSDAAVLVVDNWFSLGRPATFKNLKELHLRVITSQETDLLALDSVLKDCPALEKLCIEFEGGRGEDGQQVRKRVASMSHPLNTISLFNFRDLPESVTGVLAFALETLLIKLRPEKTKAEQIIEVGESVSRLLRASRASSLGTMEQPTSGCDARPCYMKMWGEEVKF